MSQTHVALVDVRPDGRQVVRWHAGTEPFAMDRHKTWVVHSSGGSRTEDPHRAQHTIVSRTMGLDMIQTMSWHELE